jgi:hypothetical protein
VLLLEALLFGLGRLPVDFAEERGDEHCSAHADLAMNPPLGYRDAACLERLAQATTC